MSEIERKCPACGAAMERKLWDFQIGADGRGGFINWMPPYRVDLYACPQCGKIEFYDAAFCRAQERENDPEAQEVTCPVCGAKHSPLINCPRCALNGAGDRRPVQKPKKKERKMPWEE